MKLVRERDLQSASPDAKKFTAGVWQTEALTALRDEGLRGHRFVYQPGAHSHWHTHTGEQAIVVLAGRGIVARWGEESGTEVGSGDWVHVEPGEKHRHGAPTTMSLFISPSSPAGGANGLPGYDSEYRAGLPTT